MINLRELTEPIVQAPMAGGPSTPELAAAVSSAGGLGFLAGGYRSAQRLAEDIATTRTLTNAPFGVNLFVPQPSVADPAALVAYRAELVADAERYGVAPGEMREGDDDDWAGKLDVVESSRPDVVSFTFGLPSPEVVARLHVAGVGVVCTVTSALEAAAAIGTGADALCVQGPDAGGHRGTIDPAATPPVQRLEDLLQDVLALTQLPLIAAGGLSSRADVDRVLAAGAVAAQAGTAFLRCPEAGTKRAHREALDSPSFTETAITRAFSGRYARGLVNRFMRAHDATAPLGYPEVNQLTAPLRAAAAAAGDPDGLSLWAGTGHRQARALPAADVVAMLAPDARARRRR
ncbi:nitronate monooxygenase [Pengzhenrongella sp.]|uniref:nitronate monooxygenase n=1 Tax=Pengzhenrongella sp. TaxID=2888820 RepID=UPI002F940CA7